MVTSTGSRGFSTNSSDGPYKLVYIQITIAGIRHIILLDFYSKTILNHLSITAKANVSSATLFQFISPYITSDTTHIYFPSKGIVLSKSFVSLLSTMNIIIVKGDTPLITEFTSFVSLSKFYSIDELLSGWPNHIKPKNSRFTFV